MCWRVLSLFWVFLFSCWADVESRINQNAFLSELALERYLTLTKEEEASARKTLQEVVEVIRVDPSSYFQKVTETQPLRHDIGPLLRSVLDTEIRACREQGCQGCPGAAPEGCVLARKRSGGVGLLFLVNKPTRTDWGSWFERKVGLALFFKSKNLSHSNQVKKIEEASARWIQSTSQDVNRILGSCPGPYDAGSIQFLFRLGVAQTPNPAWSKCGEKLIAEMARRFESCKRPSPKAVEPIRCDLRCMKFLCRKGSSQGGWIEASGRTYLLMGDGLCDGERVLERDRVLNQILPAECRSAPSPTPEPPKDAVGDLPSGKEVLILGD